VENSIEQFGQAWLVADPALEVCLDNVGAFGVGDKRLASEYSASLLFARTLLASERGLPLTQRFLLELPSEGVVADRLFGKNLLLSFDNGVGC
jgi:hypothetical protein